MTDDVVCKKGKCEYKDESLNQEWNRNKDSCKEGDIEEKIECELSKESPKKLGPRRKR
jgi:hypothetical protein